MGGGGSSQPSATTQTVTQSNIPEWARYDAERLFGQARALTDINQNPWQQYSGQRFSDINPLQQQYMGGASQLGPSANNALAGQMAGVAGLGGLNTGMFGNRQAAQYMSPYMRNVLDVQKQEAVRDYARQLPGLGAAASRVGGLRGSRSALVEAEGQRNLQNQMQGIEAQGMQRAYEQAQQQFNADQARRLQGLGVTLQGAGQLGQLGQMGFEQQLAALNAQRQAGADLSAQEQARLDAQYQDFIDQQNYPYKQLGFMSGILRGLPTDQTQSVYARPPNTMGQLANTALGLGSLYLGGKAG